MIVAATLATLLIPCLARAESPRPGPYVSWFLGGAVPQDRHADSCSPGGPFGDRVEFDPGITVGGSGGYDFGYVRLERELACRQGEIASVCDATNTIGFTNMHGSLGAFSVMANCFFDLHNGPPVPPYVGGIGFATLYLDDTSGVWNGVRYQLYDSDDDTVFAYQVGAGMDFTVNRYFSVDLGYRYFATGKGRFEGGAREPA